MPRRIDIELTSSRDDGTWTWRAAGAREPKGTLGGDVLPAEAKVGDVLKVDAEFFVDGIEITAVIPTKRAERKEPERLELIGGAHADEPLVTTTLAPRREDRGNRRGRPRRDGDGRDGDRRGRDRRDDRRGGREGADGEDRGRGRGDRPARRNRPEPPPVPTVERPKAKRLRAGRTHRNALLESLAEAERPIAEQLMMGGMPAVRQAIEKQNAERAAAGESAIAPGPLVELAEKLANRVRVADWRDRAEAARKDLEILDLRDLRSVVSAAGDAGKEPEARALADELKAGLATRVDAEHALWLEELTATVEVGRVVRALRLSSRPPKAGSPLPAELAAKLTAAAGAALTAEASPERWVAVLDALAFAPVRDRVIPESLPTDLHPDVRSTIARLATRIPKVAHIFEIEPDRNAPRPKVERRRPAKKKGRPAQDKARGEGQQTAKREQADKGADEGQDRTDAPTADDAAPTPTSDAVAPVEAEPVTTGVEAAEATESAEASESPEATESPETAESTERAESTEGTEGAEAPTGSATEAPADDAPEGSPEQTS